MDAEVLEFTETVFARFGYDFRGYRHAALSLRLRHLCKELKLSRIACVTRWLLENPDRLGFVVDQICLPVSSLYREPETLSEVVLHVFPRLSSFPSITVWHAGCASGHEVYSLAILLHEAGLLERCRMFASDISASVLGQAATGLLPRGEIEAAAAPYRLSGGTGSLDAYFEDRGQALRLAPTLMKKMTFVQHNLATDGVFCEANLIFCRNVLMYFNRKLQCRVLNLLSDSLARGGYLCLGQRETPVGAGDAFSRQPGSCWIYRPTRQPRLQIGLASDAHHESPMCDPVRGDGGTG